MTYAVTLMLAYCFGRKAEKEGGGQVLWRIAAILPFCITAALRSSLVGTDVKIYALPMYEYASWCSLPEMLSGRYQGAVEPLFSVYVWMITKLFGNFELLLFFLQFAVIVPFAYTVCKLAPSRMGIALLLYGLVFFGFSLNIMRQGIAISLLCAAFALFFERRRGLPLLLVILASGFHQTAIVGLLLWPIASMLSPSSQGGKKKPALLVSLMIVSFCGLVVCACVLLSEPLLSLLGGMKESYISQVDNARDGGFSATACMLGISPLLALFAAEGRLSFKQFSQMGGIALTTLGVMGAFLSQMSLISPQMSRIGMIFLPFSILSFAVMSAVSASVRLPSLSGGVAVASCLAYCLVVYVVGGSGEVFPYSSTVLPWLA